MTIALVITTYNRPDALAKVLESVLAQTRFPDLLLIADDGSGEETKAVVSSFIEIAPFPLLHVWQEDKGFRLARVRNEAIKACEADYMIFLDGDCVVNRYFVRDHSLLSEEGCFFQGKRVLVRRSASDTFGKDQANSFLSLLRICLKGELGNIHHLPRLTSFPAKKNRRLKGIKGCNMGFFRKDLLAVNGFNEDFTGWGREDSEIAVRLFRYGLQRKEHLFMAICFHLWHPENSGDRLKVNDDILSATMEKESYICVNGIERVG